MKRISVENISAKQRSRLRNGHPVRVKKGEGFNLLVHPERFDLMSKTFNRGKARTIALTAEEVLANMKVSPEAHQETQRIDDLQNPQGIDTKAVLARPRGTVVGTGLNVNPPSRLYVSNAGGSRGGFRVQNLVSAQALDKHLTELGRQVGENYGVQMRAGLGSAAQNTATSAMSDLGIVMGRDNMLTADVPYNVLSGTGLYAGRGHMFGRGRREVSTICVGGNLINRQRVLPPALQSQPYGAHFAQNAQLPPAYQTC
jgi:hypothetical protein